MPLPRACCLPVLATLLASCAAPPAASWVITGRQHLPAPAVVSDHGAGLKLDAVRAYGATGPAIVAARASVTHPGFDARRAIDGDADTEWGSGQVPGGATLTLTLAAEATVTGIMAKTGPTPTGARYWLETSLDGQRWQAGVACRNGGWGLEAKALAAPVRAKQLRLRFEPGARNQAFSVFEVQVLGGGAPTAPVPSTAPATPAVPVALPTAMPSELPAPSAVIPNNGAAIVVSPERVLHPAESRLLGTNRNHVAGLFRNGAAKLAKLRELTPTWGDRKYLYRIGHGPTDGRSDYSYMTGFHFERCWDVQTSYPYDDVRNALADAAAIGADQIHVVNFGTSDPQEAGRYVSFLNHAGDANRAAHPAPQQNVRLFELGNEIPWSIVRGHAEFAATETAYATRAKQFARAMRAASDGPIQVGAVASINSNWQGNGWSGGATTVKNILTTMGADVDFLIYHGYPSWPLVKPDDLQTVMAQNAWNDAKLTSEIEPAIRANAGGRDVRIANTEFFTSLYNDATRSRGLFGALYAADTLTLAFNHRMRTSVEFCLDHGELADSAFFFADDRPTPIYKFQHLLAHHWGDRIVAAAGRGLPTKHVQGAAAALEMPTLAFTAAADDHAVYLLVTNRTPDQDVTTAVDLGFSPRTVTAYTLAGGGWGAADADVTTRALPGLAKVSFPRASVTILEATR